MDEETKARVDERATNPLNWQNYFDWLILEYLESQVLSEEMLNESNSRDDL